MPIVSIATPPESPAPRIANWKAVSAVAVVASPFTLQQQTQEWPGQIYKVQIELPVMDRDEAEEWIGFLLSLNGPAGLFYLGPSNGQEPRGEGDGEPVIDGADQSGRLVTTRGWTSDVSEQLKSGDWLSIGNHLYKVTSKADSDADGKATLAIWPALRSSPADGDPVTVHDPVGVFRLASTEASWSIDDALMYGITFDAVEALDYGA